MTKMSAQPFSLSCPAQGSPVPSYRLVHTKITEPVGGSTPKFSGESTSFTLKKASTQPFSLSCPAQGSPVPSYRLVNRRVNFQSLLVGQPQSSLESLKAQHLRKHRINHSVSHVQLKGLLCHHIGQLWNLSPYRTGWKLSAQVFWGSDNHSPQQSLSSSIQHELSSSGVACSIL